MKKILIIIFCLPLLLFGQSVPQGVNYQAVATSSLGIELIKGIYFLEIEADNKYIYKKLILN